MTNRTLVQVIILISFVTFWSVEGVINGLKESCLDKNQAPGSLAYWRKHDMTEKDIEEVKKKMAFKFEKRHMINVGKFLYEVRDKFFR